MTSILKYLDLLDQIFEKHKDLKKHLIGETKDLILELELWKKQFIKEYGDA